MRTRRSVPPLDPRLQVFEGGQQHAYQELGDHFLVAQRLFRVAVDIDINMCVVLIKARDLHRGCHL